MPPKPQDCEHCMDHELMKEACKQVNSKLPMNTFWVLGTVFIGCFLLVAGIATSNQGAILENTKDLQHIKNAIISIGRVPDEATIRRVVSEEFSAMRMWHVEQYHNSSSHE